MHDGNAFASERRFNRQIEVRCIHPDKNPRMQGFQPAHHAVPQPQKPGKFLENFHVTPHGKAFARIPRKEPRREHLLAADAELQGAPHSLFKRGKHEAREIVAARLAGKPRRAA